MGLFDTLSDLVDVVVTPVKKVTEAAINTAVLPLDATLDAVDTGVIEGTKTSRTEKRIKKITKDLPK